MGLGLGRFRRRKKCAHASTLDVTTNGLIRLVCENCGHVAIRPGANTPSEADRSSFARRSEGGRRRAEADRTALRSHDLSQDKSDYEVAKAIDGSASRSTGSLRRV
jgi:hypothetical protein